MPREFRSETYHLIAGRFPRWQDIHKIRKENAVRLNGVQEVRDEARAVMAEAGPLDDYDFEDKWRDSADEAAFIKLLDNQLQNHSSADRCLAEWQCYINQAQDFHDALVELSADERRELYLAQRRVEIGQRQQEEAEKDQRRYFNDPAAEADFEFWGRMPAWTPEEAAALSFGRDPAIVNRASPLYERYLSSKSPFTMAFERRCLLIERAVSTGELKEPLSPAAVLDWLERHNASALHADKLVALSAIAGGEANSGAPTTLRELREENHRLKALLSDPEKQDFNSIASLYRLCLGMAIARYGYRTDIRNSAAKAIAGELEELGLKITDDTIRNHLQLAKTRLEFEWDKPPLREVILRRSKPISD